GTQNGKEVFINREKPIRVEMASNYDGTKYNLYYLNEDDKKWDYEGKDELIRSQESDEIQVAEATSKVEIISDFIIPEQETTPEVRIKEKEVRVINKELVEIKKDIAKIESEEQPEEPKTFNEDKFVFNLDLEEKEFPELSVFTNLKFEVGDESKQFSESFYEVTWESAEIAEYELGKSYELLLTAGKRKEKLIVYPVYEGADLEKAMNIFNEQLAQYTAKLNQRKDDEKRKEEELAQKLKELKEARKQQEIEWAEQRKQQEVEWKAQRKRARELQDVTNNLTRAFDVKYFGTWNCDSPIPHPRGKNITVTFADANGNKLVPGAAQLVEKKRNSMFYYNRSMFNTFKYNPFEKNYLWFVTPDYKMAYITPDEFKNVKGNHHTFTMNILEDDITSVQQVRDILEL
ncbi:MAG: hypothetical protein JKY42_11805, partial [Flavobacteriales bacterium]|nr:hypothetical protein [Flavobacteriales bacterium]